MKKLFIATIFTMSFAASASNAPAENVKYIGDMQFASFCKAVVNNDLGLFKVSLKRFVGELGSTRQRVLDRVLEDGSVQCSGKGLVEFTTERNATLIVSFLNKQA